MIRSYGIPPPVASVHHPITRSKHEHKLFNATVFDPPAPEDTTVRGLQQALFSGLMFFDIDDGDMTPEDFINIMSPYKIAFSICNSFSRTALTPNKFRVFIYLKSPVDNHDYKRIWNSIGTIIRNEGFRTEAGTGGKRSGIDRTKKHIASFFYPPCINIDHKDMAFFKSYNCDRARDMEKNALDPVKWLQQRPEPTLLEPIQFEPIVHEIEPMQHRSAQERIDAAIALYNSLGTGYRHQGGYVLVLSILSADPDENNLRHHLSRAHPFNYSKLSGRIQDARRWLSQPHKTHFAARGETSAMSATAAEPPAISPPQSQVASTPSSPCRPVARSAVTIPLAAPGQWEQTRPWWMGEESQRYIRQRPLFRALP